jgi:hypothetical protein
MDRSSVVYEPPDLYITKFVGDIDAADLRRIAEEQNRLFEQQLPGGRDYILALADVSAVGRITADARKAFGQMAPSVKVCGTAIIGASFPIRVIATLVNKAGNLLANRTQMNPVCFFGTEAEARAWLAERRAIVAKEGY